ncbi:acyl-CoA thioesterase [Gemmatimonas phototrophica]|uniref:acyl-CoA thioesterase n=1 Tax=Gemmatimonas phototrophica TaxID=1379270 RepID=UPI0005BBFD1D|nr:thioesterase family protein [Gemmatimonas phototrophica]
MSVESPRPFFCSDRVRWADVDLVGIMRYSAVTRFLDTAEQELLRAAGLPYTFIFEAPKVWMPRRHLSIDYLIPARLDDLLHMVIWVSRLGETSLTLTMHLRHDDGRMVATVSLVVVCVAVEGFAKRPLPRILRDAMAPFLCADDDARATPTP